MSSEEHFLSTNASVRKNAPMARGLLDYFPRACAAVAELSYRATQQHHPDKPMHWDKSKSTDHADCIVRHLVDRGRFDTDGVRHATKVAWRGLALLETEIEEAEKAERAPPSIDTFIVLKRLARPARRYRSRWTPIQVALLGVILGMLPVAAGLACAVVR